jgi:hypothetical protein
MRSMVEGVGAPNLLAPSTAIWRFPSCAGEDAKRTGVWIAESSPAMTTRD